jgi:hypothetical protein
MQRCMLVGNQTPGAAVQQHREQKVDKVPPGPLSGTVCLGTTGPHPDAVVLHRPRGMLQDCASLCVEGKTKAQLQTAAAAGCVRCVGHGSMGCVAAKNSHLGTFGTCLCCATFGACMGRAVRIRNGSETEVAVAWQRRLWHPCIVCG